jgi:hypothetical protein
VWSLGVLRPHGRQGRATSMSIEGGRSDPSSAPAGSSNVVAQAGKGRVGSQVGNYSRRSGS